MSDGPTRIASRGFCIYCRKTDVKLTDEHILPLSLGGVHILEKASCLSCANITKRFEQEVARGLWGDARIAYNAPSRRKKERKSHIVLSDPDVPGRNFKVPYNEYPAGFAPVRPSDGLVNAERITRRLQALKLALDDLPRQARRMARWRQRREAMSGPVFKSPLRPGPPPGHRKRQIHPVDEVLADCHWLAWDAMRSDTS